MQREKESAYRLLAERMAALFALPSPRPDRGYDISNLSGTEPTDRWSPSSGEAAKKWYRKFSIRGVAGPDDFAMMEQLVRRRFGHEEDFGEMPDLVVIDGGKGQLSSAEGALRSAGKEAIPVISLAKERVRGGRRCPGSACSCREGRIPSTCRRATRRSTC